MSGVMQREATVAVDGRGVGSALAAPARPPAGRVLAAQRLADQERGTGGESMADFLGYFSIGLGLAEILAPQVLTRAIGVKTPDAGTHAVMRLMGLREVAHGVAILSNQQPRKAVWSRVAGDMIDLALLARTMATPENDRGRTSLAVLNVLAVTALDVMTARQLSRQPDTPKHRQMERGIIHTRRSVTVRKPIDQVYAFWRNLENFPRFMRHVEQVREYAPGRTHWTASAPGGASVEWEAEIIEERPNECLSWRSLPGADVYNAGTVRFAPAPGGRGTEVRVDIEYDPPFGKLGSKLAMLFREEPGQQVYDDLRRFKQVMETGHVVVSDATREHGPHPATPDGAR